MVPRCASQPSSTLAAEREQLVRAQRRQPGRAHRRAAADQEVAKVMSIVDHGRFGEPSITTQEPAVALDQLLVGRRLAGHDRGDSAFLAQHHQQMPQAPADRFLPAAHRAAVTATPRQMIAGEIRDHLPLRTACPGCPGQIPGGGVGDPGPRGSNVWPAGAPAMAAAHARTGLTSGT